ncbi:MAG: zinc finger Ran-binding domain-containing protein [Sandaracinaceae bacterium]
MASSEDPVVCHVCGFKNAPGADRCVSCGAKLEELSGEFSAEEEARRKNQQQGFDIKWAVISFAVYLALQAVVLALLPMLIDAYDPQGFSALMVSLGVWFIGGIIVGWLSPGRTFLEPAVGALIAVGPTVYWVIMQTPSVPDDMDLGDGFQLTMPAYIIGGLLGGMISLFGAFLGEKIQDLTRGAPVAKKR